ncbi:DUF3710 domain-containing protein [Zafaria sp. Z1313]|uniref:DUF3710 domain-containing protein n=1 Tax=unclassified Zafaria TaxID=2828765 RepID=UPI002E765837|nr:DUF3710 domain-containing protein [Zafaria sp. J156]MEE1620103.1 DUF3710 domain-containing protein [Zafaria sp. J156]
MIFKRKNKNAAGTQDAAATDAAEAPEAVEPGSVPAEAGTAPTALSGPFDAESEDAPARDGYVDLGALLIEPIEGMNLRLEVEDATKRVVAVALELDGSRLQLQVFAASKSSGLWSGIADQISESIAGQGGKTDRVQGRFGEEIIARVPATGPDGTQGYMVARFIGVDGPRWFLRGVVGGPATLDRAQAERLEDRIARAIVVRGEQPMPPAELLPLRMPEGAVARREPAQPGGPSPVAPPERGPETTQIG